MQSSQPKTDQQQRVVLLTGIYSFYRADLTTFHLQAWLRQLAPFSIDQVQEAFDRHLADPEAGQFLPKPADIHRHLQGSHGDRALVAWSKAFEAIGRVGSWQTVIFDDAVIHAVIEDMGGWIQLCKVTEAELPFVQKRFCDTYRAYSRRGDTKYPARLIGMTEIENAKNNHALPAPVVVGDMEKALQVTAQGGASGKARLTQLTDGLAEAAKRIPCQLAHAK